MLSFRVIHGLRAHLSMIKNNRDQGAQILATLHKRILLKSWFQSSVLIHQQRVLVETSVEEKLFKVRNQIISRQSFDLWRDSFLDKQLVNRSKLRRARLLEKAKGLMTS
ncbi:hypothetical protein GEMRC1_001499 [Eukaryota sp. GEM-RC1]